MELLLCVCGCVCVRVCVCACVSVCVCWLVYMSMTALTESFVLAMCTPCNVMGVLYSSVGAKVEILAAETPELSLISQGPFLRLEQHYIHFATVVCSTYCQEFFHSCLCSLIFFFLSFFLLLLLLPIIFQL